MKPTSPKFVIFVVSLIIAFIILTFLTLFSFFQFGYIDSLIIFLTPFIIFLVSFFTFSFVLEKFIFQKIKRIYKTIFKEKQKQKNYLKQKEFSTNLLDDVETEVNIWAINKQQEIEDLKRMEVFRKEFLGNVSHELKTPLFNIQGYIDTLLHGGLEDPNINRKYLRKAAKNVERLGTIIQDLEMISNSENDMLNLKIIAFDIQLLTTEVFDSLERKANEADIKLTLINDIRTPLFVKADKDKIERVLINLIANSIKYGKKGGETIVNFVLNDLKLCIEIIDNGIGIPDEHLPRLFERFYRVDTNRSRKKGGTGLGLSIVKHILEAHNQNISVSSKVNEGAVFSFCLDCEF